MDFDAYNEQDPISLILFDPMARTKVYLASEVVVFRTDGRTMTDGLRLATRRAMHGYVPSNTRYAAECTATCRATHATRRCIRTYVLIVVVASVSIIAISSHPSPDHRHQ